MKINFNKILEGRPSYGRRGQPRVQINKEEEIKKVQADIDKALSDNDIFHKNHDSNKSNSTYLWADPDRSIRGDEIDIRISDHTLPDQYKQPDLDITIPGVGRRNAVPKGQAEEMVNELEPGEQTIRRNEIKDL
jgi:hypothetical protein